MTRNASDPFGPPIESTKTAELEFMLAFKKYIDAVVVDSLSRHGIDAVLPPETPRSAQKPTRWVYFIQGEDGGPVKIGVANDPGKRLADLQRTSPVKLLILGQRPGDTLDEKRLHQTFADYRLHGEWFEPCDDLLEEALRDEDVAA